MTGTTNYKPGDRVLVRCNAACRTTAGGLIDGPDTYEPGTVAYVTVHGNVGVHYDDATLMAQPARINPDRLSPL